MPSFSVQIFSLGGTCLLKVDFRRKDICWKHTQFRRQSRSRRDEKKDNKDTVWLIGICTGYRVCSISIFGCLIISCCLAMLSPDTIERFSGDLNQSYAPIFHSYPRTDLFSPTRHKHTFSSFNPFPDDR